MGIMAKGWGVKHWVFQRVANALIALFGFVLAITLMSGVTYEGLQALMSNPLVKIYLVITLIFACVNSVLAAWQIAGDYAKKINIGSNVLVGICTVISVIYLVAGLKVIF